MAILPEKLIGDYLSGSLQWAATVAGDGERTQALTHHRTLAGNGFHHLPFFFAADLSMLIQHGHAVPFASDLRHGDGMRGWSNEERALRLRYENQVLGRLLMEPAFLEAIDIIATHRRADQTGKRGHLERTQRLLVLLLQHFAPHIPRTILINAAHLRGAVLPTGSHRAAAQRLEDALGTPGVLAGQLQDIVDAGLKVQWSQLLLDEDLFELANLDVLHTEAERIGCRQMLTVARRLGEYDPRQTSIADEGSAETAFVDETLYPAGGLTGLTNRGSLENLVLSELVYIDPELDIDLFDLRMMEGELLYYLRDDGVLRRKRRTVHLLLDARPELLLKPLGYDYQLSVIITGLLIRLTWDLNVIFSRDALHLNIQMCIPAQAAPWNAELQLMRLLLKEDIEHGRLSLSTITPAPIKRLIQNVQDPTRKTYLVALTPDPTWAQPIAQALQHTPPVYGAVVRIHPDELDEPALLLPSTGAPWETLITLRDQIIRTIAELRR